MRKRISISLLLCSAMLTVLAAAGPAAAESSVWKAEKDGRTVYLGGTIHLLRESDYPLPGEFDKAYQDAGILVFETDIGMLTDQATQSKILAGAMIADGKTLSDVLSPEAYKALEEYCAAAGMPIQALSRYKPSLVMVTLLTIELQKMGIDQEGIDAFYARKAGEDGKELLYLETVDEQIGYVLSMGEGNEDDFVLHAIEDMEDTQEQMEQMIEFWRSGRAEDLEKLLLDDMKRDYPELYKDLVVLRNGRWLPQIAGYFETPATEFVLVGAAHLIGEDGLLKALGEKGYIVKKVR